MMRFTINGREFNEARTDTTVAAGTVEEWTLTNASPMDHPFHLHVWPMQIIEENGQGRDTAVWQDDVNIPAKRPGEGQGGFQGLPRTIRLLLPYPGPRGHRHDGRHRSPIRRRGPGSRFGVAVWASSRHGSKFDLMEHPTVAFVRAISGSCARARVCRGVKHAVQGVQLRRGPQQCVERRGCGVRSSRHATWSGTPGQETQSVRTGRPAVAGPRTARSGGPVVRWIFRRGPDSPAAWH
jgi:hypothetical protein